MSKTSTETDGNIYIYICLLRDRHRNMAGSSKWMGTQLGVNFSLEYLVHGECHDIVSNRQLTTVSSE